MARKGGRHWNDDRFTRQAQRENYLARSVYKLKEIEEREHIFRGANLVLDLGAAPGSWTQFALERMHSPQARVIAIDRSTVKVSDRRVTIVQKPLEDVNLGELLNGAKADLVLSDMAPKTSGIHDRDVALSLEVAMLALDTAAEYLKAGGALVVKLFMGESFDEYLRQLKRYFANVRVIRPESTRKHSREVFFVAKGFRPSET
jgi:23S rRNA (uridine2552-2'-O)-methyltransferase